MWPQLEVREAVEEDCTEETAEQRSEGVNKGDMPIPGEEHCEQRHQPVQRP